MPEAGQRLSHYRLIEKVGEGGMGVVWKAEDTTLDREVAIKVLPPAFAEDAERLARFEREAKLLAALSHPNIAAIHGLHQDGSTRFLAMEYVAGEDLASRISRGALPVDEAIEIARQIAAGLAAAHDKGVIHRDLKPANVRLMPDGTVKILDFGLAKALVSEASGEYTDSTQSPTVTSLGTVAGVILGTAAYMAPEQARGKPVDRRADMWAFGCVLYEMLTGKGPFGGETVTDTIAAVMRAEPDWSSLPPGVSPQLRRLMARCMRKDPRKRLRDAHDAGVLIDEAMSGATLDEPVQSPSRVSVRTWLGWGTAVVLALALVALGLRPGSDEAISRGRRQLDIAVPIGMNVHDLQISPDGRKLAMVLEPDTFGERELHVRWLDSGQTRRLHVGGNIDGNLFFSPDGQAVGFSNGFQLMSVSLNGGRPRSICEALPVKSVPIWLEDDTIVFASWSQGLLRVSASGGEPEILVGLDPDREEQNFFEAELLPSGDTVLFRTVYADGTSSWETVHLNSGERRRGPSLGTSDYFDTPQAGSGRLIFQKDDTLFGAVPVANEWSEVSVTEILDGIGPWSVSDEGTLAYTTPRRTNIEQVWVDRQGSETAIDDLPLLHFPRISPDGQRIAGYVIGDLNSPPQIHVHDVERGVTASILPDPAKELVPIWTPDGSELYMESIRDGMSGIYRVRADGLGEMTEIISAKPGRRPPISISQDGRHLVFMELQPDTGADCWLLSEGDDPQPLVVEPGLQHCWISPDGRWLAVDSNESGESEIYLQTIDGSSRVKVAAGTRPRWSADGTELFFRRSGMLLAVAIETTDSGVKPGRAEPLFSGPYPLLPIDTYWAVHPDGNRFLMPRSESDLVDTGQEQITVILDWDQPVVEE